ALARGKKNARRRRAWIVFQDESGVSQRPPVRRTWAPRGETPVLIHAFNWAKLSLAVGLAFRWDFRRSGLFFQTRPGSYNDVTLIGFLNELQDHFRGRRLLLIWDGLPSHKSRNMTAYLATQRSWLTIERLPGYAPELNPTELVWGNVKGRELANLCADNLGEVERAVRTGSPPSSPGTHAGVCVSPPCRPFFLTRASLYYARLSRARSTPLVRASGL